MNSWRDSSRWVAVLIMLALLNLSMITMTTASAASAPGGARHHFPAALREQLHALSADADKSFRYGLDMRKVPFAAKPDGATGRFLDVSPNHFKLQVVKGESLGETEFTRMAGGESLLKFAPRDGHALVVHTKNLDAAGGGAARVAMQFEFNGSQVALTLDSSNEREPLAPDAARKLYRLVDGLKADRGLKGLMEETRSLAGAPVLKGVMATMVLNYAVFDTEDCLIAAGECILMIGTYIASVGGLIALCPETIGAACIGALLLHPVIGAMVALKCSKAIQTCGVQKPPPPPATPPPCPNTLFGDYGYGDYGDYGEFGYGGYGGFGDPYGGFTNPLDHFGDMMPMLDMWGWSWLNPACDPFGDGFIDNLYY
jgi:hypothetical protein